MAVTEATRLSEGEAKRVCAQLNRILESAYFHGSQRCTRFLQYSVESVLAGCSSRELKERIIGIEVFHRESDYDTAQDSTVRVTANEVRKRLAQYYNTALTEDPIIELPTGSYAVAFRWKSRQTRNADSAPPEVVPVLGVEPVSGLLPATPEKAEPLAIAHGKPTTISRRRARWILLALLPLVAAVAVLVYQATHRRFDPTAEVWAPLLNSQKDVTICVAEPIVYRPWSRNDTLSGPNDYMVQLPDSVIGVGDAYALSRISGLLESNQKAWHLLPSSNTSFRDLTTGPVVLIGSFSNAWANRLLGSLRYVFVEGPPNRLIDRSDPAKGWTIQVSPQWTASEDYAVISRFKSPDTGETIIALGGATNFGTEAAGKFLADPDMLGAAMMNAPKNWQNKNFQIVLHVKVQGGAPEQPTVVARYFW